MSTDLKTLPAKMTPVLSFIKKYLVFGYTLFVLTVLAFLIFQINSLTAKEPTDDQVAQKLQTVQRPKIDKATIDKINQLQSQNVDVKSLFINTRDDPFVEYCPETGYQPAGCAVCPKTGAIPAACAQRTE